MNVEKYYPLRIYEIYVTDEYGNKIILNKGMKTMGEIVVLYRRTILSEEFTLELNEYIKICDGVKYILKLKYE